MLDFCSVSSRVGKVAVLLNGDLKRCSISHKFSLGLCPNWMPPNVPELGNKPTPPTISEQDPRTPLTQGRLKHQEAGEGVSREKTSERT